MANVQLAVAGDETTQVILSVPGVQGPAGSNLPPSGTTNQVLYKQSSTDYDTAWSLVTSAMITDGTIVNGDINASAAIAGTKISPDFGSQNVVTTGTATAASFIPTSSGVPANGLYLPSANNVAISTGGSGRLFVDASGNVGINNAADPTSILKLTQLSDATSGGIQLVSVDGNGAIISRLNDGGLTFRNGGFERLRITSAGLVGVGTSSPSTLLTVQGDATLRVASGNVGIGLQTGSLNGSWYLNDADDSLRWYSSTGGDRLTISSSGNVGIGTSSPGTTLDVAGTIRANTAVVTSLTNGILQSREFGGDSANNTIEYSIRPATGKSGYLTFTEDAVADRWSIGIQNGSDALRFISGTPTTGTERARIDSSGRLLVGTSSSTGANSYTGLVVKSITNSNNPGEIILQNGYSNALNADSSLGSLLFQDGSGDTYAQIKAEVDAQDSASGDFPGRLVFSTTADGASSPTERMRIGSNGSVQIGTSAYSGNSKLAVSDSSSTIPVSYGGASEVIGAKCLSLAGVSSVNQLRITFTLPTNITGYEGFFVAELLVKASFDNASFPALGGIYKIRVGGVSSGTSTATSFLTTEVLYTASTSGNWTAIATGDVAVNAVSGTELTLDIDNPGGANYRYNVFSQFAHNCSSITLSSVAA